MVDGETPDCNVLVVEDDPRLAMSLQSLFASHPITLRVAASIAAANLAIAERRPDAAFIDLGLPDGDGIDLIADWAKRFAEVPLVVLSSATSEQRIRAAVRAGAVGYLLKSDLAGDRLIQAIAEARNGGAPLSGPVARLLLNELRSPTKTTAPNVPGLTQREQVTLQLLAEGTTYAAAAHRLGVSINTVRCYVRGIYDKLAVGTKTEAVLAAMRLGIVRPPTDQERL
jgi:DNA-binding NarL/FixJ family response regulator